MHHHNCCLYKKASANVLRFWGLPTWERSKLDNWWLDAAHCFRPGYINRQSGHGRMWRKAGGLCEVCWLHLNAFHFPFYQNTYGERFHKVFLSEISSICCEEEQPHKREDRLTWSFQKSHPHDNLTYTAACCVWPKIWGSGKQTWRTRWSQCSWDGGRLKISWNWLTYLNIFSHLTTGICFW